MSRVNVFDVAALGGAIACGIGAIALFDPLTLPGTAAAFLGGVAVPILAYVGIAKFALAVPALPKCRNNRCRVSDYSVERRAPEGDYYRCACGDLYLLTADDELRAVQLDGTTAPYKRRFYAGGPWRPPFDLEKPRP